MMLVIWLHDGSSLVALLWRLRELPFVNLVTFLCVALHFEELVARFVA